MAPSSYHVIGQALTDYVVGKLDLASPIERLPHWFVLFLLRSLANH